jgi:hypothetical protein
MIFRPEVLHDVSGPIPALLGLLFPNATRIESQQFILLIK